MSARHPARRLAPGAVAAVLAAAAPLLAPAPASASVDGVETGVWWRAQPDGGSVPAPPHVPAGGLWVSSDPSGPSAMSAVRFALGDGDRGPVLTLHVAQASALPDTPAGTGAPRVVACALTAAWKPTTAGTPGAWSTRPAYDCSKGQAPGLPSADGQTLTFDLGGFAGEGSTSVTAALVPAEVGNPVAPVVPATLPPAPGAPNPTAASSPSTFDVTFEAPKPADIAVTTTPSSESTAGESDLATEAYASGEFTAGASLGAVSTPSTGGGATFAAAPATAASPPATDAPAPSVVAIPAVPRPVQRAVAAAGGGSAERLLFGLVFAALAVWAWRLLPQQVTGAGGRAFLTLYDVPPAAPATPRRSVLTGRERTGKPPSLR